MTMVTAYSRPHTLDEAVRLLAQPGTVAIGGGTTLYRRDPEDPIEVVDLQALALDSIEVIGPAAIHIGATTTLQVVADHPSVPNTIRDAARHELPSTLRSQATVAGRIVESGQSSEFVAALVLHDAVAEVRGVSAREEIPLRQLIAPHDRLGRRIITSVRFDPRGKTASERVGRTRADRAIVAAYGRRLEDGARRLVLVGVTNRLIILEGDEPGALDGALASSDAIGDFRGSAAYRRAMGALLATRVLEEIDR
jgi:CO/xanthine dehydrogenase FAD-binding subunit